MKRQFSEKTKAVIAHDAIESFLENVDTFLSLIKKYDLKYDLSDKDAIIQACREVTKEIFND